MYKVLVSFKDLQDSGYLYKAGDTFPRSGLNVDKKRLRELSSTKNRRNIQLIEEVKEKDGVLNANRSVQRSEELVQ